MKTTDKTILNVELPRQGLAYAYKRNILHRYKQPAHRIALMYNLKTC